MKKFGWLLLFLLPVNFAFADGEDGMSDECLRSMRDVYKFYYYEIQPNPKHPVNSPNEKLGSKETLEMQVVIGELKKNCSPQLIAKVNETLKSGTNETS